MQKNRINSQETGTGLTPAAEDLCILMCERGYLTELSTFVYRLLTTDEELQEMARWIRETNASGEDERSIFLKLWEMGKLVPVEDSNKGPSPTSPE